MFRGWQVVAGAFIGMGFTTGIFTYAFTILVDPLRDEFGASLEQVMYSLTLGTLFGLGIGPLVGMLIDRSSVRHLMTLGCLLSAGGLYISSTVQSISAFSICMGFTMAVSMAAVSSMSGSAAVSRWFTVSRGRALGVAAMGTSLGGVVVPMLVAWWVDASGWRGALQNLALCAVFVIAPLVWLLIRNRPEEVGLHPEGIAPDRNQSGADSVAHVLALPEIVRMPAFWHLGLSMGAVFAAFSSMLANLAPYAARLGNGEAAISSLIAALSLAGLVGKLAFGFAADKVNLKVGLWVAHAMLLIAFAILLIEPGYPFLVLASVFFGLSTGGLLPVWNAIVARAFGVESFGRTMGIMGPVITLCILPAYAVVGRLFDATGSFTLGLWVFGGVILLGSVLLVPLRIVDHSPH
ncbi:MAG: MFS transporter [Pseudomonadota bacterium]